MMICLMYMIATTMFLVPVADVKSTSKTKQQTRRGGTRPRAQSAFRRLRRLFGSSQYAEQFE